MTLEEIFSSKGRVKILKTVIKHGEVNLTSIIRETGLNYLSVMNHIKYLKSQGLIDEIRLGRVRIYRPNWSNPRVRYLEELMRALEEVHS